MADKRDPLAWNGGHKPKPPSEGFATSVGVDLGGTALSGPSTPAPAAPPALGESFLEKAEGPQVTVKRLGESEGPEVVRPTGRVRMTRT